MTSHIILGAVLLLIGIFTTVGAYDQGLKEGMAAAESEYERGRQEMQRQCENTIEREKSRINALYGEDLWGK